MHNCLIIKLIMNYKMRIMNCELSIVHYEL